VHSSDTVTTCKTISFDEADREIRCLSILKLEQGFVDSSVKTRILFDTLKIDGTKKDALKKFAGGK